MKTKLFAFASLRDFLINLGAIPAIRFNLLFLKEKNKRISPEAWGLSG
ncbi:hypothetical protein [Flavobacterium sp.]